MTFTHPSEVTVTAARSQPAGTAPRAALAPHRVAAVVGYIDQHLQEAIGVHGLAGVVGLSPFHFARMFKAALGVPPHVYITQTRMDRAKRLLHESNLTLRDVATSVGYQTQAHFTGVFHKHVGTTPRMYRVRSREAGAMPVAQAAPARDVEAPTTTAPRALA
jgi:AraC-like DNA-binding protein